jgi:hypothetical protein
VAVGNSAGSVQQVRKIIWRVQLMAQDGHERTGEGDGTQRVELDLDLAITRRK